MVQSNKEVYIMPGKISDKQQQILDYIKEIIPTMEKNIEFGI